MKTILFNGEKHPTPGEIYRVVDVYTHYDGIYGPQTVVVLEKENKPVSKHNKLYDTVVDWLK